ncbi:MAG TPA: efflux RND transporter permease subunit, partial [Candidatus Eisenbacteria bacterium]|nr:efflux RND transporter permease subunit [Candidatus Eisenbacteria bacterium]
GEVVVLHTNGFSVRLKDLAQVVEGAEPKFGDTLIQGRPGVLLTMSSQFGANTMDATRALETALAEMKPLLEKQGIQLYPRLHRPATFIEAALGNMKHSLALGAILVSIVLFLLLGNVRTALISLIAIPLSLLLAVIALEKLGITLNTITLGGLAIALGEVVDDSIIDVENILRRLREYGGKGRGSRVEGAEITTLDTRHSTLSTVLHASLEVRSAVVYATFIVALIFLPVLTLTGLQGSFFAPLALSYILAIMASLLVALTVTPALSYALLGKGTRQGGEPRLQQWLKRGYDRLLRFVSRWPRVLIVVVLLLCLGAATRLPFLGGEFLPEFREGHFVLQIITAPGTSLAETLRLGKVISDELLKHKTIDTVEQQVGRAELGEDPWGPHRCEFHVELKPVSGREQAEMKEEIEKILKQFPGVQFEVTTFLGDRIGETVTGEISPVVVNLFGEELDLLDSKAQEVAKVLESLTGNAEVKVKRSTGAPRMVIRLRPEKMTQLGYRPVEVLEAIETAYRGTIVAQIHRGNQVADVVVMLDEPERKDPESIGSLLLHNSAGTVMPLHNIADIYPASGRYSILHEGARRRQTVTCHVKGRAVSSFVRDAEKEVAAKVNFSGGIYATFGGAAQAQAKAQRELLLHSAIAAVGILVLLSVVFHHWRNLLLVLANVPFALVGGVLAIWVHSLVKPEESSLTMGSLVGFVTLFGITTRNSIMMISHFEHLVNQEGVIWGPDAVLR